MRSALTAIVVSAALALGGCSLGAGSMLGLGHGIGPVVHDPYMALAAADDLYEIEAANVALDKAQRPEVRGFAAMVREEHTRTAAQMTRLAEHIGLAPPNPVLSAEQARMIATLQAASPASFDAVYLSQQIDAHTSAYWLHRRYALDGDEKKLRTIAANASFWAHDRLDRAKRLD